MRQGLNLPQRSQKPADYLAGRTILQIIPELDAGGAERTAIDIAGALVEAGARALVASNGGRLVSELQARGGLWVPFPAKTKNPLRMALNVGRLKKLIRAEHVDLLHARSRAPAWVAYGAARALHIPFVTTYHGAYAGTSRLKVFYNSVMARGDAVIANSHFTAQRILDLHPFARGRISVVHRGTDVDAYSPAAVDPSRVKRLREAWGVAPDERIVLLAARLTGWKGQKVLIEAAGQLVRAGVSGVKFILAGDPQGRTSYVKELESSITEMGLAGIVKLVGHCDDMPAAFMTASLVTVCSTDPEAFGRVAVEAQLFGKPLIVTDIGAVTETVLAPPETAPSQRTGWKVQPSDSAMLADAIQEALGLGAYELDLLAERARTHAERHFSLAKMCDETLEVYAAMLGWPGLPRGSAAATGV